MLEVLKMNLLLLKILKNCRIYDNEDEWTVRRSDEQLLKHFRFYKEIENEIIIQCKKYNIKCVDTSENRNVVLQKLLIELKENLKNYE